MTDIELAEKMLMWYKAQEVANEIKEEIEKAVLSKGNTFTVANIRCSYSSGRTNYEDAKTCVLRHLNDAEPEEKDEIQNVIEQYTEHKTVETTDWKKVKEETGFGSLKTGKSMPSAKLKILE